MPSLSHLHPNTRGIVLILIAILCFSLMDAMGKGLVSRYHPAQVVWWRNAGQFLLVAMLFNRQMGSLMRTRFFGAHLLRSVGQVTAAILFFLSLTHIGLAEATAIMDVNPVLITLGAAFFLGEKLGPRRLAGVLVALMGSVVIIRPGSDVFQVEALYALGAAVGYATFALVTRKVGRHEDPRTAMIWSSLIAALILGVAAFPVWRTPMLADLPLFLGMAVLGTVSQFFMIRAFSVAEAAVIAPFGYVGLLFATLWGMIFYAELPDIWTGVGAVIIVTAGLYVWHRETLSARAEREKVGA